MSSTPSRRALVKGAAWSVPVVTVAAASPAVAATCTVAITPVCSNGSVVFNYSVSGTSANGLQFTVSYTNISGQPPSIVNGAGHHDDRHGHGPDGHRGQ